MQATRVKHVQQRVHAYWKVMW